MLKEDLTQKSPVVSALGFNNVFNGRFGAVLSRAGVGKTRFLVQIGLLKLLANEQILHVSLGDPMEKINVRYHEGYTNLVDSIGYVDPVKATQLWEEINYRKIGISYNESTFDPGKIKEYLKSYKNTNLSLPKMIIIDGLDFDADTSSTLDQLVTVCSEFDIFIWFSIQTHREQAFCEDGYPVQLETHKAFFDKAVLLLPIDDKIQVKVLKNDIAPDQDVLLDPATVMPR